MYVHTNSCKEYNAGRGGGRGRRRGEGEGRVDRREGGGRREEGRLALGLGQLMHTRCVVLTRCIL